MDGLPTLPVSQAEALRDNARRNAIFGGGHKFIWLNLRNTRLMRISGIEYVHSTPYIDEMAGNVTRYNLEVRGGTTDFQYDPSRGQFRYAMLDSPHNRKFLASHYHLEVWYIEDEKVGAEIEKLSKEIERSIKGEDAKPVSDVADAEPMAPKTAEAPVKRNKGGRPRKNPISIKKPDPAPVQKVDPVAATINSDFVTPTTRVVTP